jgi:hypothetical protein
MILRVTYVNIYAPHAYTYPNMKHVMGYLKGMQDLKLVIGDQEEWF